MASSFVLMFWKVREMCLVLSMNFGIFTAENTDIISIHLNPKMNADEEPEDDNECVTQSSVIHKVVVA